MCAHAQKHLCVGFLIACMYIHISMHRCGHMCVDVAYVRCNVDICGMHASWYRRIHVCTHVYLYAWVTVHMYRNVQICAHVGMYVMRYIQEV